MQFYFHHIQDYTTFTTGQQELKFGIQNQQNPDYFPNDLLTDVIATIKPNYRQPEITRTYDVITFDSYMQPSTDGKI